MKGWPFDLGADYTCTWKLIEKRAGVTRFSHEERCEMQEARVVSKKYIGSPPYRIPVVFGYWSIFGPWLMEKKKKKKLTT